ncbi:DUF4430 domain-containing protein [Anatilimnocola sp. NA78]|uniref:DUF4430 domain-containing protein n=1 Tax=Anatilimnocola sp. NA78 TaxID=3415683 RepID=UPI003CE4E68B
MNNTELIGRRMLVTAILMLGVSVAVAQEPAPVKILPPLEVKTVQLTIDYGDGSKRQFTAIPWKEKQTALEVLEAAAKHPRGVKFKHRGSGATVLVTAIDDLSNQAGGNSWLYEVNGKLADRSCGVYEVQAGDTLLWKFGNYR